MKKTTDKPPRRPLARLVGRVADSVWRHKYFWTILVFVAHVGFVDSNSFRARRQLAAENDATQERIDRYEAMYDRCAAELNSLRTSQTALLRVARENHRMKADGEDVYYIVEPADSARQTLPGNPR